MSATVSSYSRRLGIFASYALPIALLLPCAALAQDPPVAPFSPTPWGGWVSIGAGPARGTAMKEAGLQKITWAMEFGVFFSYSLVYVGGGASLLRFDDSMPLEVVLVPVDNADSSGKIKVKEEAKVAGGYAEAGLTYRLYFGLGHPDPGKERMGLALQPTLGYGFHGLGTVKREIFNCIDCEIQEVVDYHGGQYIRAQLGVQWGTCMHPGSRYCGFIGVNPSYQHFLNGTEPRLTRYIDIAFTVGLGYPGVRTGPR